MFIVLSLQATKYLQSYAALKISMNFLFVSGFLLQFTFSQAETNNFKLYHLYFHFYMPVCKTGRIMLWGMASLRPSLNFLVSG